MQSASRYPRLRARSSTLRPRHRQIALIRPKLAKKPTKTALFAYPAIIVYIDMIRHYSFLAIVQDHVCVEGGSNPLPRCRWAFIQAYPYEVLMKQGCEIET